MNKKLIHTAYLKFVDTTIAFENRRQKFNSYMVSIILILLNVSFLKKNVYVAIVAIVLSALSISYLKYMKIVLSSKYKVIDKYEKKLGMKFNNLEWKNVKKNRTKYANFTGSNFETIIYLAFIVVSIFWILRNYNFLIT